MGLFSKPSKLHTGKIGGFFFFFSLLSLLTLCFVNCVLLPRLADSSTSLPLAYFSVAGIAGACLARYCVKGRLSVFIHEFKHSLASDFAGNKAKDFLVKKNSGHFTYEFTKHTARFNAIIALAPYCIPLFSLLALGIAYLFWRKSQLIMVAIVGFGYGIDLLLNTRDISPIQTDLTEIRGGYKIGLTYVAAMNVAIVSFLLVWVMRGPSGFILLADNALALVRRFVH